MTDTEFKQLLELNKIFVKNPIKLPQQGYYKEYDVNSKTTNDKFIIDVDRRGMIELSKYKIQTRYEKTKLPLIRIELNGPPHMNPDGRKLSRNHIHIYRETENDTGNLPWAYDLSDFRDYDFGNDFDFSIIFFKFCDFCHIDSKNIQGVII